VRRSYDLFAWVVMPNHVHIVVKPIRSLAEIMRWLKAATANRANTPLGRTGEAFRQREYFDRWIRTEKQLSSVMAYVERNPVGSGPYSMSRRLEMVKRVQDTGGKTAGATSWCWRSLKNVETSGAGVFARQSLPYGAAPAGVPMQATGWPFVMGGVVTT